MDTGLPEELRMLTETLRRFVDCEIIPVEREAYDGHLLRPAFRAAWCGRKSAGPSAIPTRGGHIFGPPVSPILYFLNDQQKERYLWPVLGRHGLPALGVKLTKAR